MAVVSQISVSERLFVALDVPDAYTALRMAESLAPLGVSFKIGMQLFYAAGLPLLKELQGYGKTVFVDLKLHDIPNTVAGAVDSLVRHGVRFMNMHAQGGPEMMQAAVASAQQATRSGENKPQLIAVTLLTSMSEKDLIDVLAVSGLTVESYVCHLAKQAQASGLDGVVCSAQEAAAIREACGPDFLLVTPGVRPAEALTQDQSRIVTPTRAIQSGADYLVVGRPIVQAAKPVEAAKRIVDEMIEAVGQ